jgi:proteasome lid subunit RPN8/RPN11
MRALIFCDTIEEATEKLKEYCLEMSAIESCGFIGYNPSEKLYVMAGCDNRSDKPDESFLINPYDHIDFIKNNKVIAVFHSHIKTEDPSEQDRLACRSACLPFLIYGIKSNDFALLAPKSVEKKHIYLKGVKELKDFLEK